MPEEKQIEWSGEGLPPVGAACEVKNDIFGGWDVVDEVLAHTDIKGVAVAIFKRDDRVFHSPADAFRPLRTSEQIAADEREKALEAMFKIYRDAGQFRAGLSALYDAGCRLPKVDA